MPRRGLRPSKTARKGVAHGDRAVNRFINVLMKEGKRSIAEGIFNQALDRVQKKTGSNPMEVFNQALENIKPFLEVKPRRVGGSTYQIPVEVASDRRLALAMRWIALGARKRGERGFSARLAGELVDAYNKTGTAWKKREDTHKMAEANKAFAHYKW
ncbi:MAG: 30S ribosomal protein S7 [Nitrospinota bacterium]|nr:30S ribosomal protein S7 [Nitrospinota bacterium]MDH5679242.1 30S ribosomal protein S7 [Nitrospinota bacterium]MDH5757665.1 30S ribosomal protein S7 [Nitrospinota bacterium]